MPPVVRGVAFLLHVPAVMAVVSMAVCALAGEWYGLPGFAAMAAITLAAGQAGVWSTRHAPPMQRYHAMRIAAVAWLLIPLAGALPLLASAHLGPADAGAAAVAVFRSPLPALFESVSGFSSTGLSMAATPSQLPHHLQWWRSFTQWVGGIGVVVLLLTVLPVERSSLYLYFSEAREEKILPTVKSTVRAIWVLFAAFTAASVALLWLAGEPAWRALNHGMTAIATGGFAITDDSLAGAPAATRLAYIPIMAVGAISFVTHYRVFVERSLRGLAGASPELRLFAGLLAGGGLVVALERWHFAGDPDWVDTAVQWTSALTTCGFAASDVTAWHAAPLLLLVVAMLVGAMGGSTGSGIKQARVAVLLRDLSHGLRAFRFSRNEVVRVSYGGRRLRPEEMTALARNAALLTAAYLLTWTAGVLALLHFLPADTALEHVFFEAASAQGNVGLSAGITSADLPAGALVTLILLMLAGRLEIFPLILLGAWLLARR